MNLGNIAGVMQMVYQTTNQTQRQAVNGSSFTDKLQEAKGVVAASFCFSFKPKIKFSVEFSI